MVTSCFKPLMEACKQCNYHVVSLLYHEKSSLFIKCLVVLTCYIHSKFILFALCKILNVILFDFFQLVAYFAERSISRETLKRNAVMQKRTGDQVNGTTQLEKNLMRVKILINSVGSGLLLDI